jgi:uncharacterized delta-60 repeat protein
VLIGGSFTNINGLGRNGLARLNRDGSLDTSFQDPLSGSYNTVISLVIQGDGKILVGGNIIVFDDAKVLRNGIARLNADGTLDIGFQDGLLGIDGRVNAIALQADGKVLVVGIFAKVNGVSRNRIGRLNADGTLDTGFQEGMTGANGVAVSSVAVQQDGKVLIGGIFTTVNDEGRNYVTRLNADGTLDEEFQNGSVGVDGWVYSVSLQKDGKMIIGGLFNWVDGVSRFSIARLNSDGTLDTGFKFLRTYAVNSIAIQPNGSVLIGGDFGAVNDVSRHHVARVGPDGTLDMSFQNGTSNIRISIPDKVAVQGDGNIVVDGTFIENYDLVHGKIVRFQTDGTLKSTFPAGFGEPSGPHFQILSLLGLQNDKPLVGGIWPAFNVFNNQNRDGITRLNSDGNNDITFLDASSTILTVASIAVQSDGKLIAVGKLKMFAKGIDYGVVRLKPDGTLDSSFQNGLVGSDYKIYSVALQGDEKILVGGVFSTVNGVPRRYLARLNVDGSLDTGFQDVLINIDTFVSSVQAQSDGKVLIGGGFKTINGISRNGIARLNADGTLDTDFLNGLSGANFWVYMVGVQNDGKVLVGGAFTTINGVSLKYFARLNTNGSLDASFQNKLSEGFRVEPFSWGVHLISMQSDGKIIIGGGFTAGTGPPTLNLARLWGSEDILPRIHNATRSGTDVNLIWDAIPNRKYRVQFKDTTSATNWTDLSGDISTSNGSASKTDSTSAGQRFYRLVLLP